MFFIGIFGIQDNERIIKEFENIVCKCGSYSRAQFIEKYTYFHFFFIPLFRWNKRYYVRFRCCNRLYKVPKDYIDELKSSNTVDIDRLEEIYGYDAYHGKGEKSCTCSHCGAEIDNSFSYCPYCGNRI